MHMQLQLYLLIIERNSWRYLWVSLNEWMMLTFDEFQACKKCY
jgi:hypothetical protein